uniref:Uncharacterized protein n=1 Tax=Phytophthora fragariae TaxID=53985 RepID=A0A6A3E8H1_9STRA|nr:hypothetical protein PF009_g19773 [Phytophthora fragariae]
MHAANAHAACCCASGSLPCTCSSAVRKCWFATYELHIRKTTTGNAVFIRKKRQCCFFGKKMQCWFATYELHIRNTIKG